MRWGLVLGVVLLAGCWGGDDDPGTRGASPAGAVRDRSRTHPLRRRSSSSSRATDSCPSAASSVTAGTAGSRGSGRCACSTWRASRSADLAGRRALPVAGSDPAVALDPHRDRGRLPGRASAFYKIGTQRWSGSPSDLHPAVLIADCPELGELPAGRALRPCVSFGVGDRGSRRSAPRACRPDLRHGALHPPGAPMAFGARRERRMSWPVARDRRDRLRRSAGLAAAETAQQQDPVGLAASRRRSIRPADPRAAHGGDTWRRPARRASGRGRSGSVDHRSPGRRLLAAQVELVGATRHARPSLRAQGRRFVMSRRSPSRRGPRGPGPGRRGRRRRARRRR